MKKIILTILISMFAFLVVGCTKDEGGNTVDPEKNNGGVIEFDKLIRPKTEIRVWIDDEKGDYMKAVIAAFNEENPDILVTHQHMGTVDSREKLKTFGPSGNGADVFQFPHDHMAAAISEDLVLQLSDNTQKSLAERIHPMGMSIGSVCYNAETGSFDCTEGQSPKLYGVANSIESIVLMYNKKLVKTPVTTFEDLVTEAKDYMAKNDGKFYLGQSGHWADSYMMQFAYSAFGFRPFGENGNDSTAVGFNTPEAQKALGWMTETLKPIVTGNANHDSQNAGAAFEAGTLPYMLSGPWMLESYQKALGDDLGLMVIPSIGGNDSKPFTGAIMSAVYKYSKNPVEATKFVEFLASDKAMEILYKYKVKLPALKTELLPESVKNDEKLMVISKQIEKSIPMPTIPSVQSYWGPGESMIKSIWNDGTDILEATKTAEAGYVASENLRLGK